MLSNNIFHTIIFVQPKIHESNLTLYSIIFSAHILRIEITPVLHHTPINIIAFDVSWIYSNAMIQ